MTRIRNIIFAGVVCVSLLATGAVSQVSVKPAPAPGYLLSDLKAKDPATRRQAALQLTSFRSREAVRPLVEALGDKDAAVREAAAFALGQIADPGTAPILTTLLADKDAEVRASTAFALGMIGNRRSIQALSFALGDSDPGVRSSAVVALGLMQDDEGEDEIIETLDDSSFDVRYDAVWALGQIGEPDADEHLRASLLSIQSLQVGDPRAEAFRQAVQNSLESLRTEEHASVPVGGRPRRVTGVVQQNRYAQPPKVAAVRQSVRAMATERAQVARISGAVLLKVLVGANGRAVRAYVVRRLGYGLDQRAMETVMQYRFDPAVEAGLPQTTWIEMEVRF